MGDWNREIYSGVHGQRRITKGKMKRKGGYKSVGIRKKNEEGREEELARLCWEDVRGRAKEGKVIRV